jgi:predicted 3-demethylubiquinone-9 3-methyltransferase (glyoxalase superfamily)
MMKKASITPFLMFSGRAEEAMEFYVSLFPGVEIEEINRWSSDEQGGRIGEARDFFAERPKSDVHG